jgi:hypothetical protein
VSSADDLRVWHDFFLLAGGASATLMGLVFVCVSLTSDLEDRADAARERSLFVTPIVFQFAYALAISAICVAPWSDARVFGWLTLAFGAAATLQSLQLLRDMYVRHRNNERVATGYWMWNGVLPLCSAILLTTSAIMMVATNTLRIDLVAVSTLALDLLGVSNSWRLIVWIIGHSKHPSD